MRVGVYESGCVCAFMVRACVCMCMCAYDLQGLGQVHVQKRFEVVNVTEYSANETRRGYVDDEWKMSVRVGDVR